METENKEIIQNELQSLYEAILTLKTPEELHKFFKDLCSRNEISSIYHRWQILLLIDEGLSYEEIINRLAPSDGNGTKVSSTTISRVKACYNNPEGGYRTALDRMKKNKLKGE